MTVTMTENPLANFSFPRTGKRGVPQQFPRRLYEMLDSETKMAEESEDHPKVITWSDSGKAFRIFNVSEFASSILPKYFRTKKFSSFQRNLNLYGFTKVRRGSDSDMYAHPSFLRDQPGLLLQLRKISAGSRTCQGHPSRSEMSPWIDGSDTVQSETTSPSSVHSSSGRSFLASTFESKIRLSPSKQTMTLESTFKKDLRPLSSWSPTKTMQLPSATKTLTTRHQDPVADRGKLDLLALVLEQDCAKSFS